MAMIAIDSAALSAAVFEVEQGCNMLGCIYDADDLDDVDYYAQQIQRAADDIRALIASAEQIKPAADDLRKYAATLEEIAQYYAEEYGIPGTASDIQDIAKLLKQIAAEGVKP